MGKGRTTLTPIPGAIEEIRSSLGWSRTTLMKKAGCDYSTVQRIEMRLGHKADVETMGLILTALRKAGARVKGREVEMGDLVSDFKSDSLVVKQRVPYTWNDLIKGAKTIADELYSDGKLQFDAVLTFPGPSSIFCGLVLATLDLPVFMRVPVYMAIFVGAKDSQLDNVSDFCRISADLFDIYIPNAVIGGSQKKILVIDDVILTGGTMDLLRDYFAANPNCGKIKFACCICHNRYALPGQNPPEFRGLPDWEPRIRFPMPWSQNSFCFEDAFAGDNAAVEILECTKMEKTS